MSNSTWAHSFWIYVFPEDLKKIEMALGKENLYPFLYGYDVGLVGFKMTWAILSEYREPECVSYNWAPEAEGSFRGMFFLRFSWSGPQDAAHLINFKDKYKLQWHLIGTSSDWLGEPVCLVYTTETKIRCRDVVKKLG